MVDSNPAKKQYTYARHKPEERVLYQIIQNNWLPFQDQVLRDTGYPLPDFVNKEFDEYLRYGFLRAQCESCHYEHLVAFSCKRRGFCPSCGGRRMSETAAHLVDSVLPVQNIRQWVISFPFQIRLCLAVKPKIMARALEITHSLISKYYQQKVGLQKSKAKTGAVTLIQRFGGSLNCNPHFHQLFIDGCYELGIDGEPIDFFVAQPPRTSELDQVLSQIIKRFTKYLENQKIIIKDNDQEFQLEIPEEDTFSKKKQTEQTVKNTINAKIKSERLRWSEMLKKTFEIDVTICPKCNGHLEQIAVIKNRTVAMAILNSLNQRTLHMPISPPTTGPPEQLIYDTTLINVMMIGELMT